MMILIIIACTIVFRQVSSNQARKVLLSERAEKLNDINTRTPDVFKVILESTIQDYKTFSANVKNTSQGLDTHIGTFLKTPLQERLNQLANTYDSSYFAFYSIDGPTIDENRVVESSSDKGRLWYPRQVKLSYYFPDMERWRSTADIEKWYPPVTMSIVTQSYEKLDTDLAGIENTINPPMLMVLLFGLFVALIMSFVISARIYRLKKGILSLSTDLGRSIPIVGGELGDIANAANRLAIDLKTSRSRSERVLDSISTGIAVISGDQRIIVANPSFLDIVSCNKNEIIDKKITECGELGFMVSNTIKEVIENGMVWNSGSVKINAGHTTKYVNVIAVAVENTKPAEAIIAISDVTESITNTMINERDASLTRLGLFTMGVAHEVRNPLTSIKGFVQLLDRKLVGRDENKYLRPVLKEIERIENLITELMNASKPQPLKADWIILSDLTDQLITNHQEQLQTDGISIMTDFDASMQLYADPNRLYQILLNLMLNSRDAMPAGGRITITAKTENDWTVIDFADTGMGIAQEDAHKIFTPFFTTKASGTGLGLSICDQIVKAHSGRMSFVSDENGTVFTVRLPNKPATEE
jgi:two-component system sensor histidine kinase AtoS